MHADRAVAAIFRSDALAPRDHWATGRARFGDHPPAAARASGRRSTLWAALAAGTLAVMTAGCGAAPAGGSGSGTQTGVTLAYAQCLRAHGVADFPDPKGSGPMTRRGGNGHLTIDGVTLKESPEQFQTAQQACRQYLASGPAGGQPSPQAQQAAVAFSQCMRAHGLPNFPDPTFDHGVTFNSPPGFDPNAPQVKAAQSACQSLLPGPSGSGATAGGKSGGDG